LKEQGYKGSYAGLASKKTEHLLMNFGGIKEVVCRYKSDYVDD
jgi:hypothetical protein